MTIVTTIFLATLFTVQLSTLSSSFTQQSKDSMLIHKEVLNEYDIKYVHPRTQPLMRDVATQFNTADSYQPHKDEKYNKVETALRQPHFRPTPSMGDGGSLGVYSHAQSPLKRNIPTNLDQRSAHRRGDYESRDHAQSPARLPSSPLKRSSVPGGISASAAAQRWGHLATPSGRRESGRV
ncbi:hypothetical protein CIHG_01956 [Coccidioides immitis H538.4]|uniref:Uncharacterized protein n=1 Tax=Coccidioides immitis H538.4 TaxID=396776 RepID=A0A0J8RG82_COCIT|nr:hypothetical protein CIHG_01956 [Coccidioides immitis H538.4]